MDFYRFLQIILGKYSKMLRLRRGAGYCLWLGFVLIGNTALPVGQCDGAATHKSRLLQLVLHDLVVFVRVNLDIVGP